MRRASFVKAAVLGAVCLSAVERAGGAPYVLEMPPTPRQRGMGGAGVAVPDRGHASAFNPALPGLSFPRGKRALTLAPAEKTMGFEGEFVYTQWDAPLFFEAGPRSLPFAGYPSLYLPRLGYLALDRMSWKTPLLSTSREYAYALAFAVAPDFLGEGGGTGSLEWTGGMALKYFSTRIEREPVSFDGPAEPAIESRGFAFDLGLAWQWKVRDGMEARAGAALLNLGPSVRSDEPYGDHADALPEQYRLGVSLEYRLPWRLLVRGRDFRWARILVAQDVGKEFYGYDSEGRPRPAYLSFFHDFDKPVDRYWEELELSTGAEVKLLEILSLRLGRFSAPWLGEQVRYTFGFGLGTPVVFDRFLFRYDYGRYFKDPDGGFPHHTWKDYGFQACLLF